MIAALFAAAALSGPLVTLYRESPQHMFVYDEREMSRSGYPFVVGSIYELKGRMIAKSELTVDCEDKDVFIGRLTVVDTHTHQSKTANLNQDIPWKDNRLVYERLCVRP